jgi:hypothetical protein
MFGRKSKQEKLLDLQKRYKFCGLCGKEMKWQTWKINFWDTHTGKQLTTTKWKCVSGLPHYSYGFNEGYSNLKEPTLPPIPPLVRD